MGNCSSTKLNHKVEQGGIKANKNPDLKLKDSNIKVDQNNKR